MRSSSPFGMPGSRALGTRSSNSVALRTAALRATALAALGAVAFGGIASAASFPQLPGDPPEPPGEDPRSPQPNIVAIVLDDIPPLDGRLWERLPTIRQTFVKEGLEFTDAHVETPTCTPGRAGFLTGQHTQNHGAYKTDGSLFDPTTTIATELQAEGYHTIQVGKYMNLFERVWDKTPPGWDDFHAYGGGYFDYDMYHNGVPRHYGHKPRDYSTDVIARLAVKALKDAPKADPVFAWITPYAMHKPWTVAPRYRNKGCKIQPWKPHGYMEKNVRDKPAYVQSLEIKAKGGYQLTRTCRGLRSVDDLVGDVIERLRKSGRLENTMLILTSDNGMAFGSQRVLFNKKAPYGTQVPLFVHWPRVLGAAPQRVAERVQNIDLAPTLCDIAGCVMGPYPNGQLRADGVSLLKLLTGERKRLGRTAVLSSYGEEGHDVPTYWSVTTTGASPLARKDCARSKAKGCRWQYTEYVTGEVELYDLSNGPCYDWKRSRKGDPCMLDNRAGKPRYAGVERQLRKELDRLRLD